MKNLTALAAAQDDTVAALLAKAAAVKVLVGRMGKSYVVDLAKAMRVADLGDFKAFLLAAHRDGILEMTRADLAYAPAYGVDESDVMQASEIQYCFEGRVLAQFHFVKA